jgi:hypothetical protein
MQFKETCFMPVIRSPLTLAAALTLTLAAAGAVAQQPATPSVSVKPTSPYRSHTYTPAQPQTSKIDPAATSALQRMGQYMTTLTAFEITGRNSLDLVTNDGQNIEVQGTTNYKVRRPNQLVIDVKTDAKDRRFIFDGSTFTVYSPTKKMYAQVAAPGTIRDLLTKASDQYGVDLPLADLFKWADGGAAAANLQSAMVVDEADVEGVATDHYAFRQNDVDWQVWIAKGDQPLPRKIVITDRSDPAMPQYSAVLNWNLSPQFDAQTFAFSPGPDAQRIQIASNR